MLEVNRRKAIDIIADNSNRLHDEIWLKKHDTINHDLATDGTLSGGEKVLANCAISIWNGNASVRLDDIIALGDAAFQSVIDALKTARNGEKRR